MTKQEENQVDQKNNPKELSLNESIIAIRVELQRTNIKKSGKNSYAGFDYFELADFLPTLNELMQKYSLNDIFSIELDEFGGNTAILSLLKKNERNDYKIPFKMYDTPFNKNGTKSMQDIQYLGALNTYYKRYLYLNAFGITDGEVIDSMDNSSLNSTSNSKSKEKEQKILPQQMKIISEVYQGENEKKLLEAFGVNYLSELTVEQASNIVKKIQEAQKKKETL